MTDSNDRRTSKWWKSIYEKLTADIVVSFERLDTFPLRLGKTQGCPLLRLASMSVLKDVDMSRPWGSSWAVRQETQTWAREQSSWEPLPAAGRCQRLRRVIVADGARGLFCPRGFINTLCSGMPRCRISARTIRFWLFCLWTREPAVFRKPWTPLDITLKDLSLDVGTVSASSATAVTPGCGSNGSLGLHSGSLS